jgi:large subunit ribosomal protein L29
LREKSDEGLQAHLIWLKKKQLNLRFQQATGERTNSAEIRSTRREVARLKTIQSQRGQPPNGKSGNHDVNPRLAYSAYDDGKRSTDMGPGGRAEATRRVEREIRAPAVFPVGRAEELRSLVEARSRLRSALPEERLDAVRGMVGVLRAIEGKPVEDRNLANALRRLPTELHRALLDSDARISWAAARVLFSANDSLAIDGGLSEELKAFLVSRAQEYLVHNRIGLITTIVGRRLAAGANGQVRVEVEVEVADRLSISAADVVPRTAFPDWAYGDLTLEVHISVSDADWELLEDHDLPSRGLARKLVIGATREEDLGLMHVDPVLNSHLLPRRTIRLRGMPEFEIAASKAIPATGYSIPPTSRNADGPHSSPATLK